MEDDIIEHKLWEDDYYRLLHRDGLTNPPVYLLLVPGGTWKALIDDGTMDKVRTCGIRGDLAVDGYTRAIIPCINLSDLKSAIELLTHIESMDLPERLQISLEGSIKLAALRRQVGL